MKFEIGNSLQIKAGFTLVEIVIVIASIGILGTWMVSLIDPAFQFKKGRDAERKAELVQIQAALELYRADENEYPAQLPPCGDPLKGSTPETENTTYLQKAPCDSSNISYYYDRSFSPTTYTLVACLENTNDPQRDDSPEKGGTNDSLHCTGDTKSYTVTNP